jgi:hypothetical protein
MQALIDNGCIQRNTQSGNGSVFDASTWLDDEYVKVVLDTSLFKLGASLDELGTYMKAVADYLDVCGITSGTCYHRSSTSVQSVEGDNGTRACVSSCVSEDVLGEQTEEAADNTDNVGPIPFTSERLKGNVADSSWALQVGHIQRIQGFVLPTLSEEESANVTEELTKTHFIPRMFDTKKKVHVAYELCKAEYPNENTLSSYVQTMCKLIFNCGIIDTRVNKYCKALHLECKERLAKANKQRRSDMAQRVFDWPDIVKRCIEIANDPDVVTHVRIVAAYISADYELDDSEKDGLKVVGHNGALRISDMANTKVITPREHELGWTPKDVDPDEAYSTLNLSTGQWDIRGSCTKSRFSRTFYAQRFAKKVVEIYENGKTRIVDHFLMVNARGKQVSSIAKVLKYNLKMDVTINDCRHLCTTYLTTVRGMTTKEHSDHANAMGHGINLSMMYYRYDDVDSESCEEAG